MTRVVLAAAHLDSDPTNNRLKNLRALCQRCPSDDPHRQCRAAAFDLEAIKTTLTLTGQARKRA
jgi:hypothetical protein